MNKGDNTMNIVGVTHIIYHNKLDDEYVVYYTNGLEEHTTKPHKNVRKFMEEHDYLEFNEKAYTKEVY